MENLFLLFISLVVIMFILIVLTIIALSVLFIRKDKLESEKIKLTISNNQMKIKEAELAESRINLENIKLQVKYEEMLKTIKERGVSYAEGVAQTFKEIDKGE
jgi:Na+-transporting NADH:ubiquinone oxidoreductase subunit NqrF